MSASSKTLSARFRTKATTALLALVWIAAVSLGLGLLLNYSNTPGRVGQVRLKWPSDSRIHLARSGKTLVMLAHPRCPCTRASMDELAQIMARTQGKLRAYVLFWTPPNAQADWKDTDLRRTADETLGVTALFDPNGVEARRFGAETSGHTLLFDSTGALLFNGGITESRGHAGDNAGESSIVALVNNRKGEQRSTFVFGCPLFGRLAKGPVLCRK